MRNIKPDNYTDEEWTNLAGTYEELMQCPSWVSDEEAHELWDRDAPPEDWKEYFEKKMYDGYTELVELGITTETWKPDIPSNGLVERAQRIKEDYKHAPDWVKKGMGLEVNEKDNSKWSEKIDYKSLLQKYMDHVGEQEGIDFLGSITVSPDKGHRDSIVFTQEEADALKEISSSLTYTKARDD